ncbi:methylmalonyl-CoA mutase family protein [Alkalihalobacillus deserti]|uniref:methylmalonyl-CoA mutase family protein n=1 Tax=Alkalihalobacillus deserti TaxID=2879466 RepID=UPI001D15BED0|nr:methylmalonyl-CoA mutase family protein [Alkalihalobacillus deserti]
MVKKSLNQFSEFDIPSYEQWREITEKSLKGASFEKRLVTDTYEGISLQPMYRKEDAVNLPFLQSLPGKTPFTRGTKALTYGWDVNQEINVGTPTAFNEVARHDLSKGQTSLNIVLDTLTKRGINANDAASGVGKAGLSISGIDDVTDALKDIDLANVPIYVNTGANSLPILALFISHLEQSGRPVEDLHGCIGMDPIAELVTNGTLAYELEDCYTLMADVTQWAIENTPNLQAVLIHGNVYHDGGSSAVEELAFALATGVEYLHALTTRGVEVNKAASSIRFSFSVGSDYFMEIAKLRAARTLWSRIVETFGGNEEAQKMTMHARTSAWTKTIFDPYVNILRATTEAFSAAVGGADSIHVSCFDEAIQKSTAFSRRIARNTSIILKEEAHIARSIDPAGGSWYVEFLTNEVAKKAWELFQETERKGGISQALIKGFPQKVVEQTASKRVKNISRRRDIFVGTNMYVNMEEKELDRLAVDETSQIEDHINQVKRRAHKSVGSLVAILNKTKAAIQVAKQGASLGEIADATGRNPEAVVSIKAIKPSRGAIQFEELRLIIDKNEEKTGERPTVFLANLGPIASHKSRADFAAGFFGVGGFDVIQNNGFASAKEAADAAIASNADIVIICGKDEDYQQEAIPLAQSIKEASEQITVLLAVKPSEDDQVKFKEAGISEFVHIGSNCYDVLSQLLQEKGVVLS